MRSIGWLLGIGLLCSPALASDPPDSEVNPLTGAVETLDSTWTGSSWDIRHTLVPVTGPTVTATLASTSADELAPRIAIEPDGRTVAAWWREGSEGDVLIRVRPTSSSSWDPVRGLEAAGEDARRPELLVHGGEVWTVFEIAGSGGASVVVGVIADEPDPLGGRTIVGTGVNSPDPDPQLHAEAGQLWVTWVQDGNSLGWSQLGGSGTWGSTQFTSMAGVGADGARATVRASILTP